MATESGLTMTGRVIVVTHVLHFAGLAAAVELAAQRATVVCHDESFGDSEALERFLAFHAGLNAVQETAPADVVAAVTAEHGRIDVLICNDAYPAIRARVEQADLDDLRDGLEAMVVTPFAFIQAVVPQMKERRSGKILLVTSAAPLRGLANYSMYAAARGGANALAVSLARELASSNIQVNAVAPNFVENPTYFPPELLADPDARRKIVANIPLGRLAKPEELAALIAFLASDRSDFITGHVMPFAGGWA